MKQLNIFLDLDINKVGYAIFLNSEYKQSGIIKTSSTKKLMEKATAQLKTNEPKIKIKLGSDNLPIGEWRKDPPTGKWRYFINKFMNFKFTNDIDRAEYMTSKLIDIIAILDVGEVNKINLWVEDSNSSHRKLEYIGMVKTYLWEGLEYKFKEKENFARINLDDIFNINVNSIKRELKTAYLTLIKKRNVEANISDIVLRDSKYLSIEIIGLLKIKETIISNDEADAINMMFAVDKLWYLKNYVGE